MVYHEFVTILCSHCGFELQVPVYCKNRFCSICSVHRNRLIRSKLTYFVRTWKLRDHDSFKFLTLTIKNQPDLKKMTDDLLSSFRKLRQRKFWKKHVEGGAFVIEITNKGKGWHVHLHMVVSGGFLPFQDLLSEWRAVSTGRGVYVKKIHSSQVLGYLSKYLTKDDVGDADQFMMSDVLKCKRLFQVFGKWHKPMHKCPKVIAVCIKCEQSAWFFGNSRQLFNSCMPYEDPIPITRPDLTSRVPDHQLQLGLHAVLMPSPEL